MNKKSYAGFLCLLCYTIFGFSFLFSKNTLKYASPLLMISIRFLCAFLFLNLLMLTGKFQFSLKGKPVFKLLLLGIVQPILYYVCESYGIARTSSSFAGVILGLLPVTGLIFGSLLLKEPATRFQILCVLLSVFGVFLTTFGGTMKISLSGTLLLLGAVLSATLFSVISRNISDVFSPFERTYIMFLLGSVTFTAFAIVQEKNSLRESLLRLNHPEFWIGILYLSLLSSVCAFLFLNKALDTITVTTQTILSNFCTVVSVPAGILIMHDRFSILQMIGILLIICSVFGVSLNLKNP